MCNCHYVGSYTVSLMWWWIVDQRTWKHQFPTLTFKLITEIEHGYCRLTVFPILFISYLITYMYIIIIIKCKLSCKTPSTETVVFMKDTFKRDSLKKELFSIKKQSRELPECELTKYNPIFTTNHFRNKWYFAMIYQLTFFPEKKKNGKNFTLFLCSGIALVLDPFTIT